MKMHLALVAFLGCSNSTPSPRPGTGASTTPPGNAPASATAEVDHGTFVMTSHGTKQSTETFSIRRSGDHLVLHTKSLGAEDPENNLTEGELETDAGYHPVRAAYRRVTPADGFEYRLGGTPLALDVTRDDKRDPQHVIARGPLEVYVEGPGLVAMTALCKVTGDVVLTTVGVKDSAWTHHVEAYRATAVGALPRIVVDTLDLDFEILCEGERLIAGGLGSLDVWFVRTGREADLTALQAAPRPPKKQWTHPVDESEPWKPLHTFLFDGFLVTRDARSRTNRLTAFDLKDGHEIVHRDFSVPRETHVMCERAKAGRLVCVNGPSGYLQILDARTLADQVDLAPLVTATPFGKTPEDWHLIGVEGTHLLLSVDSDHAVEVDLDQRTAKAIEMPKDRFSRGAADPARCPNTLGNPLKVGAAMWTIDQTKDGATLVRKVGTKNQPPLVLAFDHPSLLACAPQGGGAYIATYNSENSVLAALKPDGTVRWSVALGAHPSDLRVIGGSLVMASSNEPRRLISIDAASGKIQWVASGPVPTTPAPQ